MRLLAAVAALLLLPSAAFAACEGQDWRDALAPETMREIRARAAQVPFHEGIAFEAVRDQTRLTLFGTIHVTDPGVFVPEEIAARIEAADLLFVEVPSDAMAGFQRDLAVNPALAFDLEGPGLRSRLAPDEWETLRHALSESAMTINEGDRMRPWFAALMLETPPCERDASETGARTLDERVEALARNAGVAVDGLDRDPKQLLSVFAGATEEEQLDLLRHSLATYAADGSQIVTLVGSWNDEEMVLHWEAARARAIALSGDARSVDRWLERIHDYLVAARNRYWMLPILEWSHLAESIVIAVGAMHLPGDDGLLRLLEREGFAIRRLFVL